MSKYVLLAILNLPFVLYGYFKAVVYFKEGVYSVAQLVVRLLFWSVALTLIVLAAPIYNFLVNKALTDSPALSLADVVLATLSSLLLTMLIRVYTRVERIERQLTDLNEALALKHSRD